MSKWKDENFKINEDERTVLFIPFTYSAMIDGISLKTIQQEMYAIFLRLLCNESFWMLDVFFRENDLLIGERVGEHFWWEKEEMADFEVFDRKIL